eukprot:CAMPEP_0172603728 /NCGR_PEP_ID=MMETSP1068-20121228/23990_1 /TAXON_ID=35684 /ORGANISM="Pseudopedinella elastica, Strain CCMP716" /LENGTH=149 /DNA_ID=CAMNT_0013405575 /DNA_START=57 /DNA_END=503 /DNA_ORIENTATION=+
MPWLLHSCALVLHVLPVPVMAQQAGTNWSMIAPNFGVLWSGLLPSIPSRPLNATKPYLVASRGPFQSISLSLSDLGGAEDIARSFCGPDNATDWPRHAILAGPLLTCGENVACSGVSGEQCRASNVLGGNGDPGQGAVLLLAKFGTHWA